MSVKIGICVVFLNFKKYSLKLFSVHWKDEVKILLDKFSLAHHYWHLKIGLRMKFKNNKFTNLEMENKV